MSVDRTVVPVEAPEITIATPQLICGVYDKSLDS